MPRSHLSSRQTMMGNYPDHKHEHEPSGPSQRTVHGVHQHASPHDNGRTFAVAIVLNIAFVVIELSYGFAANSTALMADAGHNLSDVLGLVLAWGATILARKAASERYTYGLRSTSILAALANAMLLLVACGAIAWEAIERFSQPPVVSGLTLTLVATAGVIINGLSAWLFLREAGKT